MFNVNKLSNIVPYSDEWFTARLGYMTGSKISCLMGIKGIGDGGMTYIRNKVYEKLTGKSTEKNITTEGIMWGVENEPKAVKYFQEVHKIPLIMTDKHIIHDDLYSVTPDGLLIRDLKFVNTEKGEYNCETLESKSYFTPSIHMEHVECKTPKDIYEINKPLYWQVISQMFFADALRGNAIFFHPDFSEKSKYRLGHVLFKKIDLLQDFKFFGARLEEARTIYNQKIIFSQAA